ncbi:hypothetical protein QUF75_13335 [Desulfococcaceae bacterium HSG7]|nr:hypothetical protein [Desulfococcaceae bacterium HSG7]
MKQSLFRPFIKKYHYSEKILNHRLTDNHYQTFGKNLDLKNILIHFSGISHSKNFHLSATDQIPSLDCIEKGQYIPFYSFNIKDNSRTDNITDWGLKQFTDHYPDKTVTKEDIFHYTYAVLHNPAYRLKYEINLKREFPRLPFYKDFDKWVKWGLELAELHINYETVKPYALKIHKTAEKENPKPKLRAIPEKGEIILDENTAVTGIPSRAWDYKLGNRSALHWILDQHKEKKPRDKTIAEKFNTYRFADYKKTVINLLKRVCRVSIITVEIMAKMAKEEPHK